VVIAASLALSGSIHLLCVVLRRLPRSPLPGTDVSNILLAIKLHESFVCEDRHRCTAVSLPGRVMRSLPSPSSHPSLLAPSE